MGIEKPTDNISRNVGREAQRNNIAAAKIVADIVKTTLGPKGMDKMLVDSYGNSVITNDGVTILKEMEIDHPAAKMLVDIARTQESETGDGTTTAVLLAGKMLENAEKLLDRKIHPTAIVKGYELAAEKSLEILKGLGKDLEGREMLHKIALTAMTGKGAEGIREKLAEIIVHAVDKISKNGTANRDFVKITKVKGGGISESELVDGIVIEKERAHIDMPSRVEKAKILLIDFPIELKGTESESKISITSPEQLESFVSNEERKIREISDMIIASGARVVFCQKGIDDVAQYYLSKAGILGVRRVMKSDMEKISRASSGKIISNMMGINENQLGYAESVEETKIGDESLIFVRGCKNPGAISIVVRGASEHAIEEASRAIDDALGDVISTMKNRKIVAGGGAVEIELAKKIREWGKNVSGKEQLAVEEFANSLESIPEALAENAGLDPVETIAELRKIHESGNGRNIGLNLLTNTIEDTFNAGVIEPSLVKEQAIRSATEVAKTILRIDDILVSKSRKQQESPYGGMD